MCSSLDGKIGLGLDRVCLAHLRHFAPEPHALSPTVPSGLLTSQLGRRSTQGDVEWSATGERLSAEVWDSKQAEGGNVIIHSIPEEVVEASMRHPRVIIASDAIPFKDGKSHPRAAGCFSRASRR